MAYWEHRLEDPHQKRARSPRVWLSPYLLVVALSPAFLQTSTLLSCRSGETRLSELDLLVEGADRVSFDQGRRTYDVWLPPATEVATLRAIPMDPSARVYANVYWDAQRINLLAGVPGAGEATVPLERGLNDLRIAVRSPGGASETYGIAINVGSTFSCTETGVLEAIAEGGGLHQLACDGPTTIVTEATIQIDNDVVLDGRGELTLDGDASHGVLRVPKGVTAELRGFVITNGAFGGGAGVSNSGVLTLVDTTISSCVASTPSGITGNGGGIVNSGDLSLIRVDILDNVAVEGGAGIHTGHRGTLRIEDSVISGNQAQYGGGIYEVDTFVPGDVGIHISNTVISNNVSDWRGGGMYVHGPVTLNDSSVSGNVADDEGGGIYCNIDSPAGLTVTNSTIDGNTSGLEGGGVYCNFGSLQFSNSTISGNSAGKDGGGVYQRGLVSGLFTNTTISGNTSGGLGGGIATRGDLQLVNSTVADNTSVETDEASALSIGGGDFTVSVHNSIIVGACVYCGWAPPPSVSVCSRSPEWRSTGVNIESPGHSCRLYQATDLDDVSPDALKLQSLADNGGPTRTHALAVDSVAVDAIPIAACELNEDQRGEPRPHGRRCDVGSFEVQPSGSRVLRVPSEYESIQAAIFDAALEGDTVVVDPGVYVENLHFQGKDVTVVSRDGPHDTIIDASSGRGVTIGPGSALIGFTVTNARAGSAAAVDVSWGSTLIQGNIFEGNRSTNAGAAIGGNTTAPIIDGNVFRLNHCDNSHSGGVVSFSNVSSPLISNNVFENNDCTALRMTLPASARPRVIHNVIVGNPTGVFVNGQVDTTFQTFRNNIIVGNEVGLEVIRGPGPTWEHNLVFDNGTNYLGVPDPTGTNGNISVAPLFVDPANGDYRLLWGSPATDAGTNSPFVDFDFDGGPRRVDGDGDQFRSADMGAYELGW